MTTAIRALLHDRKGATAIEYGLILALIAIACVGVFNYYGSHLSLMWNFVANTVVAH
jgi:pilus assembly protein Flp/PilA